MYKVFIENKPIVFQINSQKVAELNIEETWRAVEQFIASDQSEMFVKIRSEKEFELFFEDYKYVAAAGGLVQRDSQFLFIQRNGLWDIPKGKLDPGETPEQAAVREIEEECGLISPIIKEHLLDTWHTFEHKGGKKLKKTYWYWLEEGNEKTELIPQAAEGITDVAYFKLDQLAEIEANTYQSILDVIAALKKKLHN